MFAGWKKGKGMVNPINYDYANINMDECATTTTSTGPLCEHKTGWHGIVEFWIFSRRVFACSDCGDILYGKRYKAWKRKQT